VNFNRKQLLFQQLIETAVFFGNGKNLPGFTLGVWASFLAMLTHNLARSSGRGFTRRPIGYVIVKELIPQFLGPINRKK